MTFGQSISVVFSKYAEFRGTAGRTEFWWWILFTVLVSAALSMVPVWGFGWGIGLWNGDFSSAPTLSGIWAVAVLLPTLAVTVRRLRDAGYDWANILWLLLPVAGPIILIVMCAQPSQVRNPATVGQTDATGHVQPRS